MTFLLIGLGGFLVLLLVNLLGSHGADADHGDLGQHLDPHVGGHDDLDTAPAGPSPLSLRTISIFIMIFGFSGALAQYVGASTGVASGIGLVGGFIVAMIALRFIKLVYAQQGSSTISIAELTGRAAEVTHAIPADGVGEVRVVYRGQRKDLLARSREGTIPAGTKVTIVEDLGASVLVSKIE